jgi:hypothetical protein
MEEHRAHKRVKVNVRIAYRDTGYAYKVGRVSNISKGGVFIAAMNPPEEINDYLTASIDVEDLGKIIWAQGRVVRKTRTGMGVSFTRIDSKGLEVFLNYLGVPF